MGCSGHCNGLYSWYVERGLRILNEVRGLEPSRCYLSAHVQAAVPRIPLAVLMFV